MEDNDVEFNELTEMEIEDKESRTADIKQSST